MTFFYVEIKKEKNFLPLHPYYKKRNSSLFFSLCLFVKKKS